MDIFWKTIFSLPHWAFTPYHFLLVSIYLDLLPQALYEEHVVGKTPSWELGNLRPFTHQHRCLPPYLCPGQTLLMWESIPRQVDKKSGVPEEEKGVWGSQGGNRGLEFSRRRKGQIIFFYISWSEVKWSRSVPWTLHPWDSPGKNTRVGYHFLLQGIFPTQGLNLGLPHWRQTL